MDPKWASLKDEELLKLRIRDLRLSLPGTNVETRTAILYQELAAKGLKFKPKIYFGDEWFSPEGMVAIAVPFFLAHPRLIALERAQMLEAEGETEEWFLRLIRHEAGHCFDHAYGFSKRKRWKELFGEPEQDYHPETYRPRPYSRSYVRNLDNWYAQAHPDEDFAETFAVWLNPANNWKEKYKKWPVALAKLTYVDHLAKEVADREPKGEGGYLPSSASKLGITLEKYYARRRKENAEDYPDFFDGDLREIFTGDSFLHKRQYGAARFMHRNRKVIVDSVSYWTGEKKFTISGLVRRLTQRCDDLDLRVPTDESKTYLNVAAYLATLVTHYLFTGKFKRRV